MPGHPGDHGVGTLKGWGLVQPEGVEADEHLSARWWLSAGSLGGSDEIDRSGEGRATRHYDFIAILDVDVPQAFNPVVQHVLQTYASEANKTVRVWQAVPGDLLDFQPHEKTNLIRTVLEPKQRWLNKPPSPRIMPWSLPRPATEHPR